MPVAPKQPSIPLLQVTDYKSREAAEQPPSDDEAGSVAITQILEQVEGLKKKVSEITRRVSPPKQVKLKKVRLLPKKKVVEATVEGIDGEEDISPQLQIKQRRQI